MKSIPVRHTNITGQKVFRIEIICTYIIDFEHKIEGLLFFCVEKKFLHFEWLKKYVTLYWYI